jgi:putative membrane protein
MTAAKTANVPLPAKMLDPDRLLLDGVKAVKGEAFDKAYLAAQVKAHEEAVMLFTDAAKMLKDPGLKAFAEKALPTLKEHQQHVHKLAGRK